MFSVRMNQMTEEYSALERQTRVLFEQIAELERGVRELQRLSGMGGAVERLKKQRLELEQEADILEQMTQALGRIALDYQSCENRICDNGEQSTVLYERRPIGINEFGGIKDILSGI